MFYSKTCLKRPLKKKTKIGFQDRLLLNAGQKYCRMLQGEHSAILSTFIRLQFVIRIFVLSIFECPLKRGFTVWPLLFEFLHQYDPKFNLKIKVGHSDSRTSMAHTGLGPWKIVLTKGSPGWIMHKMTCRDYDDGSSQPRWMSHQSLIHWTVILLKK